LLTDHRVHVMLALGWDSFGEPEQSISHARQAITLARYDTVPSQIAAQLLLKNGMEEEAVELCPAVDITIEPELPLYYNY